MDDLTIQAIQALKAGEKARARSLFLAALEIDADNAQAWLWLSGAVESEQDRLDCLEQVLRIDPNNQAAAKGVAMLVGKGLVPAQSRELPVEETNHPLQKNGQNPGWQHEMPEEIPAPPAAVAPDLEPEGQNIRPLFEAPVHEDVPGAPSEAPAADETTPSPEAAKAELPGDDFRLPESFFQSTGATEENFPGWMATLTPEDATLPADIAPAAEASTPQVEITPAVVQPPDDLVSPAMETPAPAAAPARPDERTVLKIKPSLATTIIVYGLGAVILFIAALGALLLITNADTLFTMIGMVLVVVLLLAVLGLFLWDATNRVMTSYTFTNLRLYLEKGVFKRGHKSIMLTKIKSVTLKQGPLQKIIGLGNLTLHTATTDDKEELTDLVDVPKATEVLKRIESGQFSEG